MVRTKIFITLCIIVFIAFPFVLNMLFMLKNSNSL